MIKAFLAKLLAPVILAALSYAGINVDRLTPPVEPPSLGAFTPVQAQKFRLAGSGVTSSATTIILQSFKLPDASTTIAMADLGSVAYGTLEPGTSKEEQVSFTGVTQNGDGTATLTGVTRGLDFRASNCSETSANKKAHAGGSIFILSNTACFYAEFDISKNATYITGIHTYASSATPRASSSVTYGSGSEEWFATKRYVDSVATSGAPDASETTKGLFEVGTQAELGASSRTPGTSAKLAVPIDYFNATSSATTTVPVTKPSGKLSQGFLDLTESYAFTTGGISNSATTTLTGPLSNSSTSTLTGNLLAQGSANTLATTTHSGTQTYNGPLAVNGNITFATSSTAYTNAVLWQYLGSSSTATTAVNANAKAAIVNMYGQHSSCASDSGGEVTIFPVGKTSGTIRFPECNAITSTSITATWSGSTITLSKGDGSSGTFTINSSSAVHWFK